MPVFLAVAMRAAPVINTVRSARVWRGDFPTVEMAADAAADAFELDDGERMWLLPQSAAVRHRVTATHTRTSAEE